MEQATGQNGFPPETAGEGALPSGRRRICRSEAIDAEFADPVRDQLQPEGF